MNLRIAYTLPPNYEELAAAFDIRDRAGVIFTYGHTIYVPSGVRLAQELLAHEAVHAQRQTDMQHAVDRWWRSYIEDVEFRLAEELPAHAAEYRNFCQRVADPNKRVRFLMGTVAARLAGPIYGGVITAVEARKKVEAMR